MGEYAGASGNVHLRILFYYTAVQLPAVLSTELCLSLLLKIYSYLLTFVTSPLGLPFASHVRACNSTRQTPLPRFSTRPFWTSPTLKQEWPFLSTSPEQRLCTCCHVSRWQNACKPCTLYCYPRSRSFCRPCIRTLRYDTR